MSTGTPPDDQANASPTFAVVDYQADKGATVLGVLLVMGATALAVTPVAYAASWLKQYAYAMFVSSAIVIMTITVVVLVTEWLGRVRNTAFLIAVSVAGCVGAMLLMHWFDRARAIEALEQQQPGFRQNVVDQGQFSLLDYWRITAAQGVPWAKIGSLQFYVETGFGAYFGWLIELVTAVAAPAIVYAYMGTSPYCRQCDRWKSEKLIANFEDLTVDDAVAAIQSGGVLELIESRRSLKEPDGGLKLSLNAAYCRQCGSESPVVFNVVLSGFDKQGNLTHYISPRFVYPGHIHQHLSSAKLLD